MEFRSISIVVPVFSEQDALVQLVDEIRKVAQTHSLQIETLFVDDGSTDQSWSIITRLADKDPSVGGIRFSRNVGKAAALMAGFTAARGDIVITMDADLQDPPEEIPRLLEQLDKGYDVVSGWKYRRLDPWHKVYPSRIFNALISMVTRVKLHDHVCGLKCYRRKVLSDLCIYGELHRFLGVLAGTNGHRVTEIPTLHRPRTTGTSKYGFSRFAKGFVDLVTVLVLTRYRWRPQHLIGVVGAWLLILSPILAIGTLVSDWIAALMPAILVAVGGAVLMAVGMVAELIVAERPLGDLYEIVERVGWCGQRPADLPADSVTISNADNV